MKVLKTTATNDRTTTTLDLTSTLKLPPTVRERVHQDIGEFLVEQINSAASRASSPLEGKTFDALNPAYAKKKKAEGLPGKANLEFEGDMLDALEFKTTPKGIELGWFSEAEAGKADGHANFSGKSSLPERRLIPGEGDEFKGSIAKEIEKIIADAASDSIEFEKADFEEVGTRAELLDVFREYFDGFTLADVKNLVTRTPDLAALLDDLDLLRLL